MVDDALSEILRLAKVVLLMLFIDLIPDAMPGSACAYGWATEKLKRLEE